MTKSTFYADGYRDYRARRPASPPEDKAVAAEYARGWMDAERLCDAAPYMLVLLKQLRHAFRDSTDAKLAKLWDATISKAENGQ